MLVPGFVGSSLPLVGVGKPTLRDALQNGAHRGGDESLTGRPQKRAGVARGGNASARREAQKPAAKEEPVGGVDVCRPSWHSWLNHPSLYQGVVDQPCLDQLHRLRVHAIVVLASRSSGPCSFANKPRSLAFRQGRCRKLFGFLIKKFSGPGRVAALSLTVRQLALLLVQRGLKGAASVVQVWCIQ